MSWSPQNVPTVNARYWRPSRPIATRGSLRAHEPPGAAGPSLRRQVAPPSEESYTSTRSPPLSFEAPNRMRGRAGSIANDASLWISCVRDTSTFAPPSGRGLRIVWTTKW